MKQNVTVACLLYLNDNNKSRRLDVCSSALKSLNTFENQNVDLLVIDNGTNNKQFVDNLIKIPYRHVFLEKNFMDIAVHMCAYWNAIQKGHDYFVYTYDDFVFYDDAWVNDAQQFMNDNCDVFCMRIPAYERDNPYYSTTHTSKSINPDSVRHDLGAGNAELYFDDYVIKVGTHEFYTTNWRPNSRPTMWRTKNFGKVIENLISIPVMQSFEALMYSYADTNWARWTSAFLNKGVCKTYPIDTSERTIDPQHFRNISINVEELKKHYDKA